MSVIRGYSVENNHTSGDKKNLLYLMIICSGVKPAASQGIGAGIEGNPKWNPTIYYQWDTATGPARVSFDWNTCSDNLSIGGKNFDRTNGNVVFIERKADGTLVAQQCGTIAPTSDLSKAAARVRTTLRDNELVQRTRFIDVDE